LSFASPFIGEKRDYSLKVNRIASESLSWP
jgi:hypothetical protein